LLRETPTMPIPRSFVIREADLAPRRATGRRSLLVTRWATAVVTLLLVLVLVGDVLTGMPTFGGAPMLRGASERTEQLASAPESALTPGGSVPVPSPEEGTTSTPSMLAVPRNGTPAPEGTPVPGESPAAEIESAAITEQEKAVAAQEAEKPDASAPDVPPSPESLPPLAPETETGQGTAKAEDEAAPKRMVVPLSPEASLVAPNASEAQLAPTAPPPTPSPRLPQAAWRGAEIGLGLILVGLIAYLIVLRRR
jgi:hypothetical protein